MKILFVEDAPTDINAFKDTAQVCKDEGLYSIDYIICKTLDEANRNLYNHFDGAIIDIKLGSMNAGGNDVIKEINESLFRIPVVIFTATPGNVNSKFPVIEVFKKGEKTYREVLDIFHGIYITGLTKIMGGRGQFESIIYEIFNENIIKQIPEWFKYGEIDPSKTEKALLRYTINHLLQFLDDDDEDKYFPEELYIKPLKDKIRTGSILEKDDKFYVIMTPACDLIIRKNGKCKTDKILLAEIDEVAAIFENEVNGISKPEKKAEKLEEIFRNNFTLYLHWLPSVKLFKGGFINFRKVTAVNECEILKNYKNEKILISPSFMKDVISRFSNYYARQGQPDIDLCENIIKNI